jgi:acyl-CoA dehydrogenase
MQRKHYSGDHLAFGDLARTFISREILPRYLEWESAGISPRELFTSAGSAGLLALEVPEEYGGAGLSDFASTSCWVRS